MFSRGGGSATGRLTKIELEKLEHLNQLVDASSMGDPRMAPQHRSQLCDEINDYPNKFMVYETIRRLRKKFKHAHPQVLMSTLETADMVMLRCREHVAVEIGGDKFLKQIQRVCRIDRGGKGRGDEAFRSAASRARLLLQQWSALASEIPGAAGLALTRAYNEIRMDGAPGGGVGRAGSIPGQPQAAVGNGYGGHAEYLQGGINERDAYAIAVSSSLAGAGGSGNELTHGGGGGRVVAPTAFQEGDLLDMVPPSVEALMDVMKNSRNLAELRGNDVLEELVAQCRSLKTMAATQAERPGVSEGKLDLFLNAHDELDAVLSLYEGVIAGSTALPLPQSRASGSMASTSTGAGPDLLNLGSDEPDSYQSHAATGSAAQGGFTATDFAAFGGSFGSQQMAQPTSFARPHSGTSATSSITALSFGGGAGAGGSSNDASATRSQFESRGSDSATFGSNQAFDPFGVDSTAAVASSSLIDQQWRDDAQSFHATNPPQAPQPLQKRPPPPAIPGQWQAAASQPPTEALQQQRQPPPALPDQWTASGGHQPPPSMPPQNGGVGAAANVPVMGNPFQDALGGPAMSQSPFQTPLPPPPLVQSVPQPMQQQRAPQPIMGGVQQHAGFSSDPFAPVPQFMSSGGVGGQQYSSDPFAQPQVLAQPQQQHAADPFAVDPFAQQHAVQPMQQPLGSASHNPFEGNPFS
jgi:hypothetical protein